MSDLFGHILVKTSHLLRWLPIVILLMLGSEQSVEAALSSDEVLELMRANDAQFDNVLVEYDYTKYEQVRIDKAPERVTTELHVDESIDPSTLPPESELWDLYGTYVVLDADQPPGPVPEDKKKWVRLLKEDKITWRAARPPQPEPLVKTKKKTSRAQMGLRWPDLAGRMQWKPRQWTKFSAIGERTSLLYPVIGPSKREWFLSTATVTHFPNPYQRGALWLQFAVGVGYSQIISDVTSFEKKGDSYHMKVEIDWWSHVTGEGTLVLDESLVVRDADFTYGPMRVVVSSEGLYRADGRRFVCARDGQFEELRGSRQQRKFEVNLKSVSFGMTDAQFDKLADMSTPTDEARYEYDDMGPIREVRTSQLLGDDPSRTRLWVWIVPQVLIIVAVLAYFVVRKWRQRVR